MNENETHNVRIMIGDLVRACRVIGEVRVMAAGSMFATLETDDVSRSQLSKAAIDWQFD